MNSPITSNIAIPSPALANALYLTGPTAVGKSSLSLELAHHLNAEIIAVDSMTLYRGMDIGTAKPTPADRADIPHHLLDILDPWQSASVSDYLRWAAAASAEIQSRGKRALFVGGTPLYFKALFRGLFTGPPADPALRRALDAEADALGTPALHARLATSDHAAAARIHPNDRRRLIRALEVLTLTGNPISTYQTQHERPATRIKAVALHRDRPDLQSRINTRVEQMIAAGWLDEVQRLATAPQGFHPTPAQAVGYKELADVLAGALTLTDAITLIKTRTRQFAKRQETWFRALPELVTLPLNANPEGQSALDRITAAFNLS